MAGERDKPEEIISKLWQVEVLRGQDMPVADAVRQIGVTQQTYYRWRNLVGRFFNRIKQFRGIARRYDRQPDNFLAALELTAIRIWIANQ